MFKTFDLKGTGPVIDLSDDQYPTKVHICQHVFEGHPESTYYGMITDGRARLIDVASQNESILRAGMVFRMAGPMVLNASGGTAMIVERMHFKGYPTIAGPLEETGRLKYVNGCTDSLIIPNEKKGDPCLNHLHIPAGIDQTFHDHPSSRIGVIFKGAGVCLTPTDGFDLNAMVPLPFADVEDRAINPKSVVGWDRHELEEGMGWYIPTGLLHSFHTEEKALDVLAWHPETESGPTDEDHPMSNRTMINDVPASQIDSIRTR